VEKPNPVFLPKSKQKGQQAQQAGGQKRSK
jgi:hypothetical protein